MTSEVRKCPKTHFCCFSFSRIHIFAICGKTKGGLEKMTHLKKSDLTSRTYPAKKNPWMVHFTPISGKNPLFLQNFKSRYLGQLERYWYQIETAKTRHKALSRKFFIYFLFWIFDSLRNQKCGKQFSLEEGFFFSKFRGSCHTTELNSKISIQKKFKKK